MTRARRILTFSILLGLLVWAAAPEAQAAGSDKKESSEDEASKLYNEGIELVIAGDHEAARKMFEKAHEKNKKDADTLNMLAFTLRKTGNLEKAFETYEKALEQRSKFPQAREYLAEAHIQAVLAQAEILKSYGDEGADHLAAVAEELRRALAEVAATVPASANASRKW